MVLRHWSFGGAGEGTFDCVEEISMQYRCFCVKMEGKFGVCGLQNEEKINDYSDRNENRYPGILFRVVSESAQRRLCACAESLQSAAGDKISTIAGCCGSDRVLHKESKAHAFSYGCAEALRAILVCDDHALRERDRTTCAG